MKSLNRRKRVVGLTARTGNLDPDCQKIIGGLWQDIMDKQIAESIRNKANGYFVGLYSNYDFKEMTYDVTVGCEVTRRMAIRILQLRPFRPDAMRCFVCTAT